MLEMGGNPDTAGTVGEAEKWTRNQLMKNQFGDIHFPGWEVVRKLGQGSFGGVYERPGSGIQPDAGTEQL